MLQSGEIALIMSPGNDDEYAFGLVGERIQEGYWVLFGEGDIRRVPIGHIHFLTFPIEGNPAQIKEKLEKDPVMRNLVESLVKHIQRLTTREHEVLPTF